MSTTISVTSFEYSSRPPYLTLNCGDKLSKSQWKELLDGESGNG